MEFYEIGKIVNTHGIRGEVRVLSSTDFENERFKVGQQVVAQSLRYPDGLALTIKTIRRHKQFILVSFEEMADLTAVEPLKGAKLMIEASARHELDDGNFYYSDIIGLDVIDEAGAKLGVIKEILSPGANDVWVVQRPKQNDLLLPAIKDVILAVDVAANHVVVAVPEGLDD